MEKPRPLSFIIQPSSEGSVMGCHASAPHSRVVLPDCWWLLQQLVLPWDTLGMLSQRQVWVCVGAAEKGAVGLSLPREDTFHRRKSAQVPLLAPVVGT